MPPSRPRRSSPDESRRVVYAALLGNVGIAVAKFVASGVSGSTAMLTEAIHSSVDSIDQVLLLVAKRRAKKRRDGTHPLGYGMEAYFWSFIVALMVFGFGGIASIYEGIRRIQTPEDAGSMLLNLLVLAVAAVFEGSSFVIAFRQYRRVVRRRNPGGAGHTSVWAFIKASKDPSLYATLLEDGGALIGIGIAALGVLAGGLGNIGWADGAASIAIGMLLLLVSGVLANETRSLIAGEAVSPAVLERLWGVVESEKRLRVVDEIATMHLGPDVVMVALTASFSTHVAAADLDATMRDLQERLRQEDERVQYVYIRPPLDG